jgi:hypothetical protein
MRFQKAGRLSIISFSLLKETALALKRQKGDGSILLIHTKYLLAYQKLPRYEELLFAAPWS